MYSNCSERTTESVDITQKVTFMNVNIITQITQKFDYSKSYFYEREYNFTNICIQFSATICRSHSFTKIRIPTPSSKHIHVGHFQHMTLIVLRDVTEHATNNDIEKCSNCLLNIISLRTSQYSSTVFLQFKISLILHFCFIHPRP